MSIIWQRIKENMKEELKLFWLQKYTVILCTIWLIYFTSVGRNAAFYIHTVNPLLRDVGYELIPAWSHSFHSLSEYCLFINHIGSFVFFASVIFLDRKENTPHLCNIGIRLLKILTIGHSLRVLTFVPTSLPGTAEHCRPENEMFKLYDPPENLWVVFTRFSYYGQRNCGDLIFSGHIFNTFSFTFCATRYVPQIAQKILSKSFIALLWFTAILQPLVVIASRNHYSVDVVTGLYLAPMLWMVFNKYAQPDLKLPQKSVAISDSNYLLLEKKEQSAINAEL